ncbi:glycosyl transferase [Salinimicrobium marinum]|uniref:Glycosyl transferase n=1 Tax=Salinimicrobium marinum TaxID=680283 RepID=A0A918W0B4_9FLAO|nr:glycosyltransferase family A protein [Salinimicrobium marinum]GHA50395.1 glycosyl transferase [Salinimicrobium marinum]
MDIYKLVSILITTKDRLGELKRTLNSLEPLLSRGLILIICDDGSTDGTSEFLKEKYPTALVIRNKESKGLIFSRNLLMNMVNTVYAISLDDDANILTRNPISAIVNYFKKNQKCGVIAFRIYWGIEKPPKAEISEEPLRVRGFVGCGHAWRMQAWYQIPNYPEWFKFYGEEQFASYHLLMSDWEVHYFPHIFIHHRVDNRSRKNQKDYILRTRRSLRSGWYLYVMFLPVKVIIPRIVYSLWIQIKTKVVKGDSKSTIGILQAIGDTVINLPKLLQNRTALSHLEYQTYYELPDEKIYWKPKIKHDLSVIISNGPRS